MRFLSPLLMLLSLGWCAASDSHRVESHGPTNRTLMIIGGTASDIFYSKFMELVGGADAPIVVIPTAITSDNLTTQGSYLARGDTQKNTIMMGDHKEGLGFISNVAIDQHLLPGTANLICLRSWRTGPNCWG